MRVVTFQWSPSASTLATDVFFTQPLKLFVGPQSNSYHNFFFSLNSQNSGVNSLLEVIKAVSLGAGDWKNTVLLDKRPVISVHPVNLVPNHDHIIQKVLWSVDPD